MALSESKFLSPEKFAYHEMLLFFPFSDLQQLLSCCPPNKQTPRTGSAGSSKQKQNKI